MIMHINLSCLQTLVRLVLHLTLQIWSLTLVRKMRLRRGRLQFKKGSMMWTSLLLIQPLYLQQHTYKDPSQDLVPNNLTIRNDGPSMDERDKHWSMAMHGDGSKHVMIQEK